MIRNHMSPATAQFICRSHQKCAILFLRYRRGKWNVREPYLHSPCIIGCCATLLYCYLLNNVDILGWIRLASAYLHQPPTAAFNVSHKKTSSFLVLAIFHREKSSSWDHCNQYRWSDVPSVCSMWGHQSRVLKSVLLWQGPDLPKHKVLGGMLVSKHWPLDHLGCHSLSHKLYCGELV